jgi:hypothetical protein
MSDRYVLVRVTDPEVRGIRVTEYLGYDNSKEWGREVFEEVNSHLHPVPEDDQLRQDLDLVTDALTFMPRSLAPDLLDFDGAKARLRAAAGLDQEDI